MPAVRQMMDCTVQCLTEKERHIMTNFTIHTLESAPENAKPILQKLKELIGFVPNLAATMANAPTVLETFASIRAINARSSFSGIEREVLAMTAAREIRCSYCMAAHS